MARPRIYKSVEEMDEAIQAYFDSEGCDFTITGLALALGFCDKQSIYDYQERAEFSYSIKKARMVVENAYELGLRGKNVAGCIFALKNFGWKDTQHTENKTEIDIIDYDALDEDTLRAIRNATRSQEDE